jgi:iron(III) transport system substrate-binding protein
MRPGRQQFLAQACDVDLQGVGANRIIIIEHLGREALLRDDGSRPAGQRHEDCPFPPPQVDRLTADRGRVVGRIADQITNGYERVGIAGMAPQQRPDPGPQFGRIERLGQVIVGTGIQPAHLVFDRVSCRQDKDGGIAAAQASALDEVEPTHSRQTQIDCKEIVWFLADKIHGIFSGIDMVNGMAIRTQQGQHSACQGDVILYHQYPCHTPSVRLATDCVKTAIMRHTGRRNAMIRRLLALPLLLSLIACNQLDDRDKAGTVVVYSTIDAPVIEPLVAAFEAANQGIEVAYHSLTAAEVSERFLADRRAGRPGPDLLINSAMDLQVQLANDGQALEVMVSEIEQLPDWAHWRNRAYAVGVEPVVIGYHAPADPGLTADMSRAQLSKHLLENRANYLGKIGIYDPEGSSTGMLLINQDLEADPANWELVRTIGTLRPHLYNSSSEMIADVSTGKLLLAYGILGSYAFQKAAADDRFQIIMPGDYTLLASRVALIPTSAPRPDLAQRLLAFLLSRQGQQLVAEQGMIPVRLDLPNPYPQIAGIRTRAIRVGPALLTNRDRLNTANFIRRWRAALGTGDP